MQGVQDLLLEAHLTQGLMESLMLRHDLMGIPVDWGDAGCQLSVVSQDKIGLVDHIGGCRFYGRVAGDQGLVEVQVLPLLVMSNLID